MRPVAKFNMRNRALQEIGRAGVERANPAFAILSSGDDDCRNVGTDGAFPDFADERRTVHFGHTVIDDQQVGRFGLQPFECLHCAVETFCGKLRTHHRHILRVNA